MSRRESVKRWASLTLTAVLLACLVAMLAVKFTVGWFCKIPQDGMYPTLRAGTSFFCVDRPYKEVAEVGRGDIVVFRYPEGPDGYVYVWRVVGLPGDSVAIDDSRVTLNGKPLPQQKARLEGGFEIFRETNGTATYEVAYAARTPPSLAGPMDLTVPAGHLFVLGDNRRGASDSRIMGPIPFASITGRRW